MATIKRLVLEWDDSEWVLWTNTPGTPGFITQGGTLEEVIEKARDAATELGLEWPAEKSLEADDDA